MKLPDADDLLEKIAVRDPRYAIEAYGFLRAGLDFTVRRLERPRHVSGHELLDGLREFALNEFGPMAQTVLNGWGIERTEDFGEMVFNLVDAGLLGRTDEDDRADFADGYDFDEAFRRPFRPAALHTSA
jgi:uncharacterized repeat protein (TIGR04138 family)